MKKSAVYDRARNEELKNPPEKGRKSQRPKQLEADMDDAAAPAQGGSVNANVEGEMRDETIEAHPELLDSEEPPPPQLRRARSTSDSSKKVKDKNRGMKNRDASGAKHQGRPRTNKRKQTV